MRIVKNLEPMHLVLYLFALFCLSQSAHWVKWSHSPVELLGFWRLLLASLAFLPFLKPSDWQKTLREAPTRSWVWAAVAGFLLFLHLWTFQYAAQHTRIANQMILFASNPLWTAGITIVFLSEKLTPRLIASYVLSLSGIAVLVSHQLQFEEGTLFGDLTAIASAVLYSAYIVSSQRARQHLPNSVFSLILFPVASLCFALWLGGRGQNFWPENNPTWIAIFGLTIMSTLLGHSLFAYLLKHLNINWMSCGKLLEPVLAAVTAWWIFDETVRSTTWIAFALTACGVLVLFLKRTTKKIEREEAEGEIQ